MIGRSVRARDRRGMRGFFVHASRSASVVGGLSNRAVVSNGTHSAPAPASTPSRSLADRSSSKNARWRTSTAYLCERGRARRKPARVPRSAGANDPGSWIQRAWARGPSGSIAARNDRSSSSTPMRRRSCVSGFGSLTTKRKSGAVCRDHDSTVLLAGVA